MEGKNRLYPVCGIRCGGQWIRELATSCPTTVSVGSKECGKPTYVTGHVLHAALPLRSVEVLIAEPCVPVVGRATPSALRHVVV